MVKTKGFTAKSGKIRYNEIGFLSKDGLVHSIQIRILDSIENIYFLKRTFHDILKNEENICDHEANFWRVRTYAPLLF